MAHECPRQSYSLPLSTRERCTTLTYLGVVAVIEFVDEPFNPCKSRRVEDLLAIEITSERDVAFDRVVKEERLL